MEEENIHRDWTVIWRRLLKNPQKNIRRMCWILGRSSRFLSILSTGGSSSAYSSYADTLRSSVEEIFRKLVEMVENEESHMGIFCILANYTQTEGFPVEPIIDRFIRGEVTVFLVRSVEKICRDKKISGKISGKEEDILEAAVKIGDKEGYEVGEGVIRVVFEMYGREEKKEQCLSKLMELFQMKYIDLYLSKIFPKIVKDENILFVISLVRVLIKIEGIPILTITQHIEREKLLSLPEDLVCTIVKKAEKAELPQEQIGGMKTLAKIPELVEIDRLAGILANKSTPETIYSQAEALLEYIETVKTLKNQITILGNIKTKKEIKTFLDRLLQGTDSSKIQFCRILYHTELEEYRKDLLLLTDKKNIRVKWNALRALTVYNSLEEEEIEKILALLNTTEKDKIKLWALKILERTKRKFNLSSLPVKETIYKEEIEALLKRINI